MAVLSGTSCGAFTPLRLSIIFVFLCTLYVLRDAWIPMTPGSHSTTSTEIPFYSLLQDSNSNDSTAVTTTSTNTNIKNAYLKQQECLSVPGADRVMIILKTGSTEIYEKLPTHLLTLLRCTPHYLIFSDVSQTFSNYRIYDALDTVSDSLKHGHEDFKLYRKLQWYYREGQNPVTLKGDKGWNLDKWKFMPILHETFRMAPPEIDWFVHIEADTSLSWSNLLLMLRKMKAGKPIYMGAQNVIGSTTFGHGGSGWILSREAAKRIEAQRAREGPDAYDERWESLTSSSCCGDEVVARALMEVDVPLTPSWPRIQGETVSTLDWTRKHWCTPAVTFHHVSPVHVDALWKFQQQWTDKHGYSTPYLYRDVFDRFVSPHISVNRTSWNNLSKDTKYTLPRAGDSDSADEFHALSPLEQRSVRSPEDCVKACAAQDACLQWMWLEGKCQLGKDIRLGDSDDRNDDEHWTSGWMLDRIEDMREALEPCSVNWTG